VPSASRNAYRASLLATCVLLLAVVAAGCQTTQDTAAEKQAQSKRILEQREQKQKQRKADRKKDQER
jgi:Ni/Co efflux regulator RcnB